MVDRYLCMAGNLLTIERTGQTAEISEQQTKTKTQANSNQQNKQTNENITPPPPTPHRQGPIHPGAYVHILGGYHFIFKNIQMLKIV